MPIHSSAIIAPGSFVAAGARIAEGVTIGPFCTVGADVSLAAGVELISHVVIDGHTDIGEGVRVFPFATIGLAPQDLKYKGEATRCVVGARTVVREAVTIHRGSVGGVGVTTVGPDCMLMATVHVGHDCTLGHDVILANDVILGGHVRIDDTVFVGGGTAVHQFVHIGRHSVIGGMTGVEADVIPYGAAMGNRARHIGLNLVGLKRRGFSRPQIHALRAMFRLLFRETGLFADRVAVAAERFAGDEQVAEVLAFIAAPTKRGLCKAGRDPIGEDEDEAAGG